MKTFREIVLESDEKWTVEDLIQMIRDADLNDEEVAQISDIIIDMADEDEEEAVTEKMSKEALKKAAKLRKTAAYKKAQKLKKKCMEKNKDKIAKTKNSASPLVCGSDGKLKKGMSKQERMLLIKARKQNKSKITD